MTGEEVIRAAGLVVLRTPAGAHGADRRGLDGLEVLAVHRRRYQDWSLPKGKLEPGERPVVAAVREVHEETGVWAVPGRSLPAARYLNGDGRPKTVDWWLGSVASTDAREPDDEVDESRWLPAATAGSGLTHPMDADLLAGVAGLLDRGTAEDAVALLAPPIVLLRHASARSRKSWDGPELARPLDDDGLAQSEALVGILSALRPTGILCSSARRCRQTVQPFADAFGLEVADEPDLTEQAYDADSGRPRAVLARVAANRGAGPRILCTHRPVIGPLLEVATGQRFERGVDKPLRTAELAVLTGSYGAMSAERHLTPPPSRGDPADRGRPPLSLSE